MKRDLGWASDGGGFFAWKNKRAYLYVQPSEQYTRQLILHEATHQFHHLTRARMKKPTGFWWIEGVAEYFGMHNWDGKSLKTGVVPAITLEDYPAKALSQFNLIGGNMMAMMTGEAKAIKGKRHLPWAWIHFLRATYPKTFTALTTLLDKQMPMQAAWAATFKLPPTAKSKLVREFKAHLLANQQPWKWVWNSWQQRGKLLRGKSGVNALAVLKTTPEAMGAMVTPNGKKFLVALVFGFRDSKNFHLLQMTSPTHVKIMQYTDGKWTRRHRQTVPERRAGIMLALKLDGARVTFTASPDETV